MSTLRLKYQTIEFGKTDIHVRTLRNRQEYSDPADIADKLGISSANWSLFGVIWASEEVLARLMFDYEIDGKRVLEVGCGIGLASLVLDYRKADITATDYHPEAGNFLLENTRLNRLKEIPFTRTTWGDAISALGEFDLIIGSDLLYEAGHAELLAGFIDQHAKPHCKIIIIDPGRRHHGRFSANMKKQGYRHDQHKSLDIDHLTQPVRGVDNYVTLEYSR